MIDGRMLCHVQHLMGSGHQWRVAAIARAMCRHGVDVTYVTGGFPVPGLQLGCARLVQLPPARSPNMRYKTLADQHGRPVNDAWRAQRRGMLLETFAQCRPDVLLVETFPFGRGLLRFELLPLLEAAHARRPRPLVVCSVRDILEQRHRPGGNEEIVRLLERYFDLVLVHSDPALVPFDATFPLTHCITHKLHYTGYVMAREQAPVTGEAGTGEVIVSAGGGAFGEHLLRAAMDARALSALAHLRWRILVGQNLPQARFERLRSAAADGLIVERNRPDFTTLLKNCALSISQAGYNTMLEVLACNAPAVFVPYSDEREQEQAIRARVLAGHGLVNIVENHELTPQRLAQATGIASTRVSLRHASIDVSGAETSAQLIAAHIGGRTINGRVERLGT
ncbi:MAG: glycosyltransferase family protein [Acidiferrobacterales bacterium]